MAYYQTPTSVLANYRYDPASPRGLAWARDYTKGKAVQYVEETLNRLHGEYARSQPHV